MGTSGVDGVVDHSRLGREIGDCALEGFGIHRHTGVTAPGADNIPQETRDSIDALGDVVDCRARGDFGGVCDFERCQRNAGAWGGADIPGDGGVGGDGGGDVDGMDEVDCMDRMDTSSFGDTPRN